MSGSDQSAQRRPRHVGRWLRATALFTGLGLTLWLWAYYSIPHLPDQIAEPKVTLSAATIAQATAMPAYEGVVPVITYHDVSDQGNGKYALPPQLFAEHMRALKDAGFHSVDLETVRRVAVGEKVALPSKPILITFDDGLLGNYLAADPILAANGFNAVGFLITSRIRPQGVGSSTLNESEVAAMNSSRWEFGGHTDDLHRRVLVKTGVEAPALINRQLQPDGQLEPVEAWRQRATTDLANSQIRMKALTGKPAKALAYPYGAGLEPTNDSSIPSALAEIVSQQGYALGFLSGDAAKAGPGYLRAVAPGQDLLHLPRIGITSELSAQQMLAVVASALPSPMPASFDGISWTGEGGTCTSSRHTIVLQPTTDYVACRANLNGSQWRDYRTTTTFTAQGNCSGSVGIRSADDMLEFGRVDVSVGNTEINVREINQDQVTNLAVVQIKRPPTKRVDLDIAVQGQQLSVFMNGKAVLATKIKQRASGGIQLSSYCPKGEKLTFTSPVLTDLSTN